MFKRATESNHPHSRISQNLTLFYVRAIMPIHCVPVLFRFKKAYYHKFLRASGVVAFMRNNAFFLLLLLLVTAIAKSTLRQSLPLESEALFLTKKGHR